MSGKRGRATARQIMAFASAPPKNPTSKIARDTTIDKDIEVTYRKSRPDEA